MTRGRLGPKPRVLSACRGSLLSSPVQRGPPGTPLLHPPKPPLRRSLSDPLGSALRTFSRCAPPKSCSPRTPAPGTFPLYRPPFLTRPSFARHHRNPNAGLFPPKLAGVTLSQTRAPLPESKEARVPAPAALQIGPARAWRLHSPQAHAGRSRVTFKSGEPG